MEHTGPSSGILLDFTVIEIFGVCVMIHWNQYSDASRHVYVAQG